ncbi:MAG: dephospho-CoA kinase [Proteobacteria bacterium]|nr:MAG: dephospho-CoA kinase [Pseudomonadota bacterium]
MQSKGQSPPILVAITGSIGSGKSTAAAIFKTLGADVIDADQLAREAVMAGSAALGEIARRFGKDFILPNGELDRKAMGKLIFNDSQKRAELEAIVHPQVRKLFKERLSRLAEQTPPPKLVAYVVPLLFEAGYHSSQFDAVIVVSAPREVCLARIMQRDGCSIEEAESRYDSQLPIEEKSAKAGIVLNNSRDVSELEEDICKLYPKLLELSSKGVKHHVKC